MKRLVERDFPAGTVEASTSEFLAKAEPFQSPVGAKQRVRARLLGSPVRGRRIWLLHPAFVGGLLLFAALASAAAWRSQRKVHAVRAADSLPQSAEVVVSAPQPPTAEGAGAIVPPPPAERPAVTPTPKTPSEPQGSGAARRTESPAADEARALFEAAGALRRDGDPARASRMLDDYFRKFPRGALAEEALALSIEAASARGDARARTLAKRYLELYPKGNFRAKAEHVLARSGE